MALDKTDLFRAQPTGGPPVRPEQLPGRLLHDQLTAATAGVGESLPFESRFGLVSYLNSDSQPNDNVAS
jgi:hypothetical protein